MLAIAENSALIVGGIIGWRLARRGRGAPIPTSGFFKGSPSMGFRVAGCAFIVLLLIIFPLVVLASYIGFVPLQFVLGCLFTFTLGVAFGAMISR